MKIMNLCFGGLLIASSALTQAAADRDCVLEGTVKKQSAESDKVYVAFHSARPAEQGSSCRMRSREKLQFKAPRGSEIESAKAGTKVEYRYKENKGQQPSWELRSVSDL